MDKDNIENRSGSCREEYVMLKESAGMAAFQTYKWATRDNRHYKTSLAPKRLKLSSRSLIAFRLLELSPIKSVGSDQPRFKPDRPKIICKFRDPTIFSKV